jgi:uncharacterized coiled-coil protein SlyX
MRRVRILLALLVLASVTVACSKVVKQTVVVESVKEVEKVVTQAVRETVVLEKVITAAPAAGSGGAAVPAEEDGAELPPASAFGSYQSTRKIIKDGEMTLVVADTDEAIDDITRITVDHGGYLLGLQVTLVDGYKWADIAVGVPVDEFETVQRAVRAVALRVTNDQATGVDVTEEYVDTQSRLTNLEATQARIREFLAQAKTVEESLRVNAQLAEIEAEIEQVKGRLNFLKERAAYSTLRFTIEPERATPTPTPTATMTPTPTVTPSPTPVDWRPSETLRGATRAITGFGRGLWEVVIWIAVVLLPVLAVPAAIIVLLVWLARRGRARRKAQGPTQPPV